jgi:hypothetical protein
MNFRTLLELDNASFRYSWREARNERTCSVTSGSSLVRNSPLERMDGRWNVNVATLVHHIHHFTDPPLGGQDDTTILLVVFIERVSSDSSHFREQSLVCISDRRAAGKVYNESLIII